jgi:23S rRNA (uracil1939-C5)-methyltransferase
MVEENKTALSIARDNIHGEGREHFALSCDSWAKVAAKKVPGNAPAQSAYGFAVIDPPRTGLSFGIRSWLCQNGPPILAYVSCDPATQARDSKELVNSGYTLASLAFYDFYPQTAHIESLAVFCRCESKS